MSDSVPELKKDSTMKVTAKEGAEFLEKQGSGDLIYKEGDDKQPKLQKDTTIQATVKEAEKILEKEDIDKDSRTRGDQQRLETAKADSEPPKVPRDNTMVTTAAEGKEIIGDAEVGETRAQTKALQETTEVSAGGDEASLKRSTAEKLKEGEEILKKQKTTNGDSVEVTPAQEAS